MLQKEGLTVVSNALATSAAAAGSARMGYLAMSPMFGFTSRPWSWIVWVVQGNARVISDSNLPWSSSISVTLRAIACLTSEEIQTQSRRIGRYFCNNSPSA